MYLIFWGHWGIYKAYFKDIKPYLMQKYHLS